MNSLKTGVKQIIIENKIYHKGFSTLRIKMVSLNKRFKCDEASKNNTETLLNMIHIPRNWIKDYEPFPLLGLDLVQRTFLPLARRRFNTALPLVVLILRRKPWVRARDFLDLLLLVRQSAAFPALTTRPRPISFLTLMLEFKSNPRDKPAMEVLHQTKSLKVSLKYFHLNAYWLVLTAQKTWLIKSSYEDQRPSPLLTH